MKIKFLSLAFAAAMMAMTACSGNNASSNDAATTEAVDSIDAAVAEEVLDSVDQMIDNQAAVDTEAMKDVVLKLFAAKSTKAQYALMSPKWKSANKQVMSNDMDVLGIGGEESLVPGSAKVTDVDAEKGIVKVSYTVAFPSEDYESELHNTVRADVTVSLVDGAYLVDKISDPY
ncbi:MAG: hypothetical protein LUC85_02575 [Bacteroidales bacterium]|nr:hypothetical protein [Bacteroidales bacterium]MCD8393703.1 hypothetical protein [Bacteroidales bacterium]